MATPEDHELARDLATDAGALLLDVRAELVEAGADGRELKDEGDRRSHELLMRET